MSSGKSGYPLSFILHQLIPVILGVAMIAVLIRLIPEKLIQGFIGFGKFIALLAIVGLVIGIAAKLTGIETKPYYLDSIDEGLSIVGSIMIVLPGAYVVIELLSRIFHKAFLKLGTILGVNDTSVLEMLATLANSIPTFSMIKNMDAKRKVLNFAFITGGAFALGDYLGFCAAVAPKLIVPMLTAKLTAGISAVLLVLLLYKLKLVK